MSAAGRLADPDEVRAHPDRRGAGRASRSPTPSCCSARPRVHAAQDAGFVQGAWRRSTRRRQRGEPELAVLVVRQSDGLPGQGWWVGAARRARLRPACGKGPKASAVDRAAASGVRLLGMREELSAAANGRAWATSRHRSARTLSPSPRTMTAFASTAGSSATCPTSASTSSRAGRGPGSCALDGKRAAPGDRIEPDSDPRSAARRAPERSAAPQRAIEPLTTEEAELVREMVIYSRPARLRAEQAAGPRDAGRDQDPPASRPPARRARRRCRRRPSSSTGSTRTRRARCWWRARRGPPAISPRPFPAAPRARSIGRWLSASRRSTRA